MKVIQQAYPKAEPHTASLNQSLTYIRTHSLILDIECEKTVQPRHSGVSAARLGLLGVDKEADNGLGHIDAHVSARYECTYLGVLLFLRDGRSGKAQVRKLERMWAAGK